MKSSRAAIVLRVLVEASTPRTLLVAVVAGEREVVTEVVVVGEAGEDRVPLLLDGRAPRGLVLLRRQAREGHALGAVVVAAEVGVGDAGRRVGREPGVDV